MKSSYRGEKYVALTNYLKHADKDRIMLKFNEIERIIGFDLPASARRYGAFWCNPESHTLPFCFLSAGYQKAEADIVAEYIVLEKIKN